MYTKSRTLLAAVALVVSASSNAYSRQATKHASMSSPATQSPAAGQLDIKLDDLVRKIIAIKSDPALDQENKIKALFDPNTRPTDFMLALAATRLRTANIAGIMDARLDKQLGSGDASSGTTSLVAKGSVPAILGFAVENGALKRESSGTTITFRGNPVGIIQALGKKGFIASYDDDTPFTRVLRRLSFAVSFDTDRGSEPGTFVGDRQQLSSYSFRFDILNKRDPRHPAYADKWFKFISARGQELTQLGTRFTILFEADPNLTSWLEAAQNAIIKADASSVKRVIKEQLFVKLSTVAIPAEIRDLVAEFEKAVNAYSNDRSQLLGVIANGSILTFEYTNTREPLLPDLSNFRLIFEASPWEGKASLTANASLTIFNKKPTEGMETRRLRDFQLAGQVDVPLGQVPEIGSVVLTFSGKYQHLTEDTMIEGLPAGAKGNIGIGQLKLTIPVKGSGMRIPISVTFANRTELIKEKEVRGNIGITFDLDSVFAKLKP